MSHGYLKGTIAGKHPTSIEIAGKGVHESVMLSYQILGTVKHYLRMGVPADALLDMIEAMEASASPEPWRPR